jgi:hypothetical protein
LDVALFATSYSADHPLSISSGALAIVNFGKTQKTDFYFDNDNVPEDRSRMQAVAIDDSYSANEITIFSAG